MDAAGLVQLIGAILGAGSFVAIINGIFGRKKMSADVVKTINDAADTAVKRTEEDNQQLREERRESDLRVEDAIALARKADERAWRAERRADRLVATMREYIAYAHRQAEVIRVLGGRVDDPPDVDAELLA